MSDQQEETNVISQDLVTKSGDGETGSFAVTEEWQISDNWTPLHAAADALNIVKVRAILSTSSYAINATTKETHETALHKAVQSSDDEFGGDKVGIIKFLVSHGADLNPHDCVGNTPLHYAAKGGYLDAAKMLIELGAVVDV
ncbi:ankyrin, partial [Cadophora sp. DSE1049]